MIFHRTLALLGLTLLSVATVGCGSKTSPSEIPAPSDPIHNSTATKKVIPDTERQAKPHIGAACAVDRDCPLYLRCERLSCVEPPALDGVVQDASTVPILSITTSKGDAQFFVETAKGPEERARGLMHRPRMHKDWGMIFVYPSSSHHSFWMRNTLIPLDIIFISKDREIVGISENAEPLTETSREVPGESQYVLEINGGLSKTLGIEKGNKVYFLRVD